MTKLGIHHRKIQHTHRYYFKVNSFVLHSLCYLSIVASAFNDNFPGLWLSVPFAFLLFKELTFVSLKQKILNFAVIALTLSLYFIDKSSFSFLYPALQNTYVVSKDKTLYHDEHHPFFLTKMKPSPVFGNDRFQYHFEKGTTFKVNRQYVVSHADMATYYAYGIKFDKEDRNNAFVETARSIRTLASSDNHFYEKMSKDMPYLSETDIRDITDKIPAHPQSIYLNIFFIMDTYIGIIVLISILGFAHLRMLNNSKFKLNDEDRNELKDIFLE